MAGRVPLSPERGVYNMGLESAPQNPLGRIDPSSIVARASEVVTPNAVDALSDAVRKGFITAEDISARVSGAGAAREKTKLEELIAKEEQGPEAVKARSAERQAKGAEATSRAAIAPTAQTAKEAELKAAILDAQLKDSGVLEMQNALTKAGWPVAVDPSKGLTQADQAEITRRFGVLLNFLSEKSKADSFDKESKVENPEIEVVDASGATVKGPSQTPFITFRGQQVPAETFKKLQQYKASVATMTPAMFDALGQPKAPSVFGEAGQLQLAAPVATPAPAAPSVPAEIPVFPKASASQSEAVARDAQLSQFLPDAVQPKSAAKPVIEMPTEAAPGQPFGPLGMVTSKKEAPSKPYTEVQGRALIALNRAAASNKVLNDLEQNPEFDPTAITSQARMAAYRAGTTGQIAASLTGMTPEERNYVSSAASWLQGLLRLESGAAISHKEQAWYDRTFFPVVGDDKSVQSNKALARKAVETAMEQVISGRMTPQQYESLREQVSGPVGASGTSGARGTAGPVITLSTGRRVQRGPDGQYYDVP